MPASELAAPPSLTATRVDCEGEVGDGEREHDGDLS